jgi:ABC-type multidrug transport system ATPase subunit
MERLMQGRAVIIIAHRLSTLRNADKIIVVKNGVVAEDGTHDELLHHGGVYAHLHHVQSQKRHEVAAATEHGGRPEHSRIDNRQVPIARRLRSPCVRC